MITVNEYSELLNTQPRRASTSLRVLGAFSVDSRRSSGSLITTKKDLEIILMMQELQTCHQDEKQECVVTAACSAPLGSSIRPSSSDSCL